jgi:FAD dependent oxidoreductase TIGR03364
MTPHYDVAVVGGGIVGLAHAWMAARRRLRVVLLERTAAAEGASVRNFGMIWPIGQPTGELHSLALRSREFWLELDSLGVLPVESCGSIHLAHRQDELAVQEEFCRSSSHEVQMLTAREVVRKSALANPDGLLAGMFSPTELRVDPRSTSARIAAWLGQSQGVETCFHTSVIGVDDGVLTASDRRSWKAERVIVCSGSDLQTLYPSDLQQSGLIPCKLQMLKTVAQPNASSPAPHLASGLTLGHYKAFRECTSLPRLRSRIESESPELVRFGIHVMASQFPGGEITLGDSHEYGNAVTPFDSTEIDELIVRECRKVFRLSDWTIRQRWNGIYCKHPSLPVFEGTAEDGTCIFVGTGGAGMTMSFGLAERSWKRWQGEG